MNKEGNKKVATLCVLKNKNKFLLLKRYNEPNKDKYVPVGGKLKNYESPKDGVIRETLEETGIIIKEPKFFGILTESSPTDYNWISYIFCSEIKYILPPTSDEGKLEWIEYDKIKKIPTPLTDHHIYKFILENKKFIINAQYNKELKLLEMTEEISNSKIK
tara:strand:+ start:1734 stop:2216 length:483 start_codon:yes stop_codon:yes gene_type:complete